MTVRVGVVGTGGHSRRQHGPALARVAGERDSVELTAVCDLDAERAATYAADFGFAETYTDVDRLLAAESLDALVVVSPVDVTRELVGDLLPRGLPLLVEKPPGRTPAEARELLALAREHGTLHAVSFNRRFDPAVARAREWLATRPAPSRVTARLARVDRLEEHFVWSTGVHAVDLALSFCGTPRRVAARRWRSRDAGGESADALVDCGEDTRATVLLDPDAGRHEERYRLVGPGYTVAVDVARTALEAFEDGEPRFSWAVPDEMPACEASGALDETRAFLDAVERGDGASPTLAEGFDAVRVARAIDSGGTTELDADP